MINICNYKYINANLYIYNVFIIYYYSNKNNIGSEEVGTIVVRNICSSSATWSILWLEFGKVWHFGLEKLEVGINVQFWWELRRP